MLCVLVKQYAEICLFAHAQYKCTVAELDTEYADVSVRERDAPRAFAARMWNVFGLAVLVKASRSRRARR